MKSIEEKEIRLQLRDIRTRREQIAKQLEDLRKEKINLNGDREKLLAKAEKAGIQFGKKTAA